MKEWVKEFLIAIGGGSVAILGVVVIIRFIAKTLIEKTVETAFEKSTIKLTNQLQRSTKAYELLLNKELECYGKFDPQLATLVPLVQDLAYYPTKGLSADPDNAKAKFKENVLRFIPIIKDLKNSTVLYQPYIPEAVFIAACELVRIAQKDMEYLRTTADIIFGNKDEELDVERLNAFETGVLKAIGLLEMRIKSRLKELSEP